MMCGTAICVLLLAAQAPPAPGHDHLYQDTLRNGLRLVLAEDHAAPLVHLRLLVGTGPGLASEDPPGLGLLIASAALREARRRVAGPCDVVVGPDHVGVAVCIAPAALEATTRYLAACLSEPDFTQSDLDHAREQMIRAADAARDDVVSVSRRAFLATAFLSRPLRDDYRPTVEQLGAVTLARAREHHKSRFQPERTVLAVVGDVTIAAAFHALRAAFEPWERGDPLPVRSSLETAQVSAREATVSVPDQTATLVGFKTVAVLHPDRLALDVIEEVLRARLGMFARHESIALATSDGYATFLSPQPASFLLGEIDRVRAERLSRDEIDAALDRLTRECGENSTDGQVRSMALALALLRGGDPQVRWKRWQLRQLASPDEVLAVAGRYLAPDQLITVHVAPAAGSGAPGDLASAPSEAFAHAPNGMGVGVAARSDHGVALALYLADVTRARAGQMLERCDAKLRVLARSALPPVVAEPSDGGLLLSMTAADADLVLLVQAARAFVEDPADAGKEPSLAFVPGELPASVLLGAALRWMAETERHLPGELLGVGVAGALTPAPVQEMVAAALGRRPRQQRAAAESAIPTTVVVPSDLGPPKVGALFLFAPGRAPPPPLVAAVAEQLVGPGDAGVARVVAAGARVGVLVEIETTGEKAKADLDALRARWGVLREGKLDAAVVRAASERAAVAQLAAAQDLARHARSLARRAASEDHDFDWREAGALKEAAARLELAATLVLWPKDLAIPDDLVPAAGGH